MKTVLLFTLISIALASAETQPRNQLKLIPQPKEVQLRDGNFRVGPTTRILVEFGHQAEDRIAAETLAEEIHDQSGLTIGIWRGWRIAE
jgi:hypothetical protein